MVICHARELAYQICKEFTRFAKYMPEVDVKVFFGGINIGPLTKSPPPPTRLTKSPGPLLPDCYAAEQHYKLLAQAQPHVAIGTPGRMLQLAREKKLKLHAVKRFIIDEADQVLEGLSARWLSLLARFLSCNSGMRKDVQAIFRLTPREKQVMLFSATLSKEIRPVCKKFCNNVRRCAFLEIVVR